MSLEAFIYLNIVSMMKLAVLVLLLLSVSRGLKYGELRKNRTHPESERLEFPAVSLGIAAAVLERLSIAIPTKLNTQDNFPDRVHFKTRKHKSRQGRGQLS